jgi:hypothetical protein
LLRATHARSLEVLRMDEGMGDVSVLTKHLALKEKGSVEPIVLGSNSDHADEHFQNSPLMGPGLGCKISYDISHMTAS